MSTDEKASHVHIRWRFVTSEVPHGENFMAIFTTLSVVIRFSTGTLEIFPTLVYVFTLRVVIYTGKKYGRCSDNVLL